MAPGASSPPVDLRAQVIENCEFFSGPHARISLVIAKEPLGTFKAIVLKTEDRVRDAVLSETGTSFIDALQALHVRSAEAVQNYISSNGFAMVSSVKKRSAKLGVYGDGHESDSSTVTLDDCESLSDDETVSVTSVGRAKRSRRKADKSASKTSSAKHKTRQGRARSRSPSFSTSRARSRSTCSSSSDFDLYYDPPALPSRRPPFHNGFSQRMPPRPPQNYFSTTAMGHPHLPPPPPPPGPPGIHAAYAAAMSCMPPLPPAPAPAPAPAPFSFNNPPFNTNKATTTTSSPTTTITPTPTPTFPATTNPLHQLHQQNQPQPQKTDPTPLHDIILLIRWRHHGERRTLEQTTHISARAIQQAALAFVRRQHASFSNVPSPSHPHDAVGINPHLALAGLRAAVRGVVVDGVGYDLSAWPGEDLGRVVAGLGWVGSGRGGGGLLRFEVEVWNEVGHGGGHGQLNLNGRVVPTLVGSGAGAGSAGAGGSLPSMIVDVPGNGLPPRMVFPSVN